MFSEDEEAYKVYSGLMCDREALSLVAATGVCISVFCKSAWAQAGAATFDLSQILADNTAELQFLVDRG